MHIFRRSVILAATASVFAVTVLHGQDENPIQELAPYIVHGGVIANETPLPTYANPISLLSFAPGVDIQSRNFSEAQGDISIRGGTFENTGITIGSLALWDPQTGHYLAELPVDPNMLARPRILTGFDNQISAFNANVGSIAYDWRAISTSRTEVALSFGENSLNTQSIYTAQPFSIGETRAAIDVGLSHSNSDGAIEFGDHDFKRYSGRIQIQSEKSALQLFAGYQDKFFGWPNMYTPYGVQETEDIQTLLLLADYTLEISTNTKLNLATYYRVNWDDYEFDRDRPGIYNPYEHKTKLAGLHGSWEQTTSNDGVFGIATDLFADSIESTTLTNSFQSRTYAQIKAYTSIPEVMEKMKLNLSVSYFDTNRNDSSINGAAKAQWDLTGENAQISKSAYLEYSGYSQVSGYTAVGSSNRGLFAGNPNLDIETSHNFEIGYQTQGENTALRLATFYRLDRDLTDWTYSFAQTNARSANPVDIDTFGIEIVGTFKWEKTLLTASHTFLKKTDDYGSAEVDASFYALNYPTHRTTLSLIQNLSDKIDVRLDSEYRIQEDNALRQGDDSAALVYLSLVFRPMDDLNWDLRFSVENLLDSDFQDIPAVPASPRQFAVQSSISW